MNHLLYVKYCLLFLGWSLWFNSGCGIRSHESDDVPQDQVLKGDFTWGSFDGVDLNRLETLGQKNFGAVGKAEGPVPEEVANQGFGFKYYKKRSIKGDGSCWVRALTQSAFYPVLHIDADYNKFVKKLQEIPSVLASLNQKDRNRLEMLQQKPVEFSLKLLATLKHATEAQRHELYNYEKVDLFLDWFFRSVIAMQQLKDGDVAGAKKTLTHRSWSDDENQYKPFTRYFEIAILVFDEARGGVRFYDKGNYDQLAVDFGFLPESAYTHVATLFSTNHAEIIERTTPYKASRRKFNIRESCSGLAYLLEDKELSETGRCDHHLSLLNITKNVSYLHLAVHLCGEELPMAFAKMKPVTIAAMINLKDLSGNTPLHYWALNWNLTSLEALLAQGADPNIRNAKNKRPVDELDFLAPFRREGALENYIELINKTKFDAATRGSLKRLIEDSHARLKITQIPDLDATKTKLFDAIDAAPYF